ncbi:hypothetical protein BH09MYX1_BH09MYX1_65470 [soil metagenome]
MAKKSKAAPAKKAQKSTKVAPKAAPVPVKPGKSATAAARDRVAPKAAPASTKAAPKPAAPSKPAEPTEPKTA